MYKDNAGCTMKTQGVTEAPTSTALECSVATSRVNEKHVGLKRHVGRQRRKKLAFFSSSSSGRYFRRILKRLVARFLSSVLVNWLMAGGTLRRFWRILRWRWMRTYLGHLT